MTYFTEHFLTLILSKRSSELILYQIYGFGHGKGFYYGHNYNKVKILF